MKCMHTIVMGIKSKSSKIFEYNVEKNDVYELHKFDTCFQNYSHNIYQTNQLFIVGGSDYVIHGKTNTSLFECNFDNEAGKIRLIRKYFPPLQFRRFKHSSVILRDHLFVFFG